MNFKLLLTFFILSLMGCNSQNNKDAKHKYTNDLINETSPYLLQHAHNPVQWHAWNSETLAKAKKENKLLLISIGYAACHWCHVMEHESFEDTTVANLMNKYYISIKVDREERPDVDQVYMDAAHIMTGRGGWPLNVIALPDGRPIYAGTYFRKDQWLQVLQGVQDFYEKTPEKALEQAMQVASGVNKMNIIAKATNVDFSQHNLEKAAEDWVKALDNRDGGRQGNMKFPMPKSYLALLNYAVINDDTKALEAVKLTLNKMAEGGIYDQIGGGFSRYSTDPKWLVPHFEKMLYDNAQLITLYSEAYKLTKDSFYKGIIEETIEFCSRELGSTENAYFSSLDADSEGEEGKYYVWSVDEVDDVLGDDKIFKEFYGISKGGNWEGKNVLNISTTIADLAKKHELTKEEVQSQINKSKQNLFNARDERIRPGLDDKVLTSWNGLMVTGLVHAYEALGNEDYRAKAIAGGEFIWTEMWNGEYLYRNRKNGLSSINGFLDDYAYSIMAFVDLYQITFNYKWLERAETLTKVTLEEFYNQQSGMFQFKSSKDDPLYVKKSVVEDNVIPSGNSAMAINLFNLGHLLYNEEYIVQSKEMLATSTELMLQHAAFYYNWFDLYQMNLADPFEVAIVGKDYDKKRMELSKSFLPSTLFLGGADEGNLELLKGKLSEGATKIYVCVNKTCQLPTEDPRTALNQMDQIKSN